MRGPDYKNKPDPGVECGDHHMSEFAHPAKSWN